MVFASFSATFSALAEEPDLGSWAPADAAALVAVRDVRPLLKAVSDAAKAAAERSGEDVGLTLRFLQDWEGALVGPFLFMVFPAYTADGRLKEPDYGLRVPLRDSSVDLDDLVRRAARLLPGPMKDEPAEGAVKGVRFGYRYRQELYWTVKEGSLFVSNSRDKVEKLGPGPGGSLAQTDDYRELGKHVDWEGEVVLYGDLGRLLWPELLPRRDTSRGSAVSFNASVASLLRLDQFRAVAFSWRTAEVGGSGRLAVLTDRPRSGLAALFGVQNGTPSGFECLPASCQVVQWQGPLGKRFVERSARFLAGLDPDVSTEFLEELAEFNDELGVDLGRDFLDNTGNWVMGVQADLPQASLYLSAEVGDAGRFQRSIEALAAYNQTPLERVEEAGRAFHAIPFQLPLYYYYSIEEGRLVASTRKDAILKLSASSHSGKSQDVSAIFGRLLGRLPRECLLLWAVDLRWIVDVAGPALSQIPGLAPQISPTQLGGILRPLREIEPGLSFGFAFRREPDAFVFAIESIAVDPWKVFPQILKGLIGVRAGER